VIRGPMKKSFDRVGKSFGPYKKKMGTLFRLYISSIFQYPFSIAFWVGVRSSYIFCVMSPTSAPSRVLIVERSYRIVWESYRNGRPSVNIL
jgi:hypothetical protein